MGNSKNKAPKKRKASAKSKKSSDQKENVPKNEKSKVPKPNPDDTIAMSKQLLSKKKNSSRSQSRSSLTKQERVCPNGKVIPSLAELEKMFEDSDEDENQTPKTSTQDTCVTPKKQIPASVDKNNILSPTTIHKIAERVMNHIQTQNLPDPTELLEVTPLLIDDPPPPPVIPPKKRKKPDVPYIVGCKDRPQVIRKPNTNFCKGDDDYGVEASPEDQEEEPATKRAKKSRIPNYSKSIFNAQSDEIAERLAREDAGALSDGSSDSNKTIEYDPTAFQHYRPHSFSPLPSTSTDKQTFIKNDELFNASLKEMEVNRNSTPKKELTTPKTEPITPTKELTTTIKEESIPTNIEMSATIIEELTTSENKDDDIEIFDTQYDTIVIDDDYDRTTKNQYTRRTIETDSIEIFEPVGLEVVKPKNESKINIIDDEDSCMIIPSVTSHKPSSCNEPIVIDDEYRSIDLDFPIYNNEPIEIDDVDDIIAETKSVLDKLNKTSELNNINTVVEVPVTYKNTTTPQLTVSQSLATSSSNQNVNTTSSNNEPISVNVINNDNETSSCNVSNNNNQRSQNNQRSRGPANNEFDRISVFQTILDHFFSISQPRQAMTVPGGFDRVVNNLQSSRPNSSNNNVTTNIVQNTNSQRNFADLSHSSSNSGSQQIHTSIPPANTTIPPPSPASTRNIGDCPICLDPLASNGIASTICGHVFCLKCIQAAVKSNGKKCPTCRKALKGAGGGYHQLYL